MARSDEDRGAGLAERLATTRELTLDLAEPLSDADATVQPHPDASPAKWHLAHTTWFFETFILRDHVPSYRLFDERWPYLFNSYYNGEGERHARPKRGMLSRPSLDEVRSWRLSVDAALQSALPQLPPEVLQLIELGINHEQQHQELFLTDILAAFAENPLEPAYGAADQPACYATEPLGWIDGQVGEAEIGAAGSGFAFDCERPRHKTLLAPHKIANRCVTNGEWQQFIEDGGYGTPTLWLSDGWDWINREGVDRPLYWHDDGSSFTLAGRREIDRAAPVSHVSYYEADAFARWAGARLPTDAEWETAFASADALVGNQLDRAGPALPRPGGGPFGDVWQWTGSAFLSYPGFKPETGTVGEYNGKFMSGQMVLKGASCATPRGHSRPGYRNFFPPAARWQFTGVRLARDA
ncbi:ergothioneine biosynthesis protein EgtB [Sphingomonas sp. NSE70-1]|uniref:Ergothioneine biosynthesis protein EgtB n=1 Tax=Sphingomonas caseinilyticus TaxID=2908205 RepID=A0ABT0RVB2_9SPHN|nr:ergothioneine biosynthesis protein EgtB [Sphingomonas caseinilyticus]MCL6698934.1 ergothioneine biosynthesis protein EgtB [Sphingomonas caseinilyticus]